MEVLNCLYKSKKVVIFEDGYGGSPSWKFYYSYILFKEKECYSFFSFKPFEVIGLFNYEKLKPIFFFDDYITLKNISKIINYASHSEYKIINDNEIKFRMPVQIADEHGEIIEVNRNFTAELESNGKFLRLKAYDKNDSKVIVIDSEFERVEFITL